MPGLRRPPLYRASRYVSIAATLIAVLILVYVGIAVYSASQLRQGSAQGNSVGTNVTAQGFQFQTAINFTNPGPLPVNRVQLSGLVFLPGNTTRVASGSSPNVSIAPGTVGKVPFDLLVPFANDPALATLLTHNEPLPATVWANVSFARLFDVGVRINTTIHWGAPFDMLNVTLGTPTETNGTTQVPVTLSFVDNAPFPVAGALALTLSGTSGGCSVAVPTFPLSVAPGQSESAEQPVTVPSGCSYASGASVAGTYTGPTWSVAIPSEAVA